MPIEEMNEEQIKKQHNLTSEEFSTIVKKVEEKVNMAFANVFLDEEITSSTLATQLAVTMTVTKAISFSFVHDFPKELLQSVVQSEWDSFNKAKKEGFFGGQP